MCLYEVFAKMAIKIYAAIKSGKIPEITLSPEEEERKDLAKEVNQ